MLDSLRSFWCRTFHRKHHCFDQWLWEHGRREVPWAYWYLQQVQLEVVKTS